MIINTGMRTDIPAFYSEWFMNRIRAGYVLVRNPYRPDWITRYELNPDVVDCIAFCTKNPEPMLKHLKELKPYHQYWFVTITPYGRDIEPNVPAKEKVMQDFIKLSEKVGVNCVGWRYDPIFLSEEYTPEYHLRAFEQIASALDGYTEQVVISFIDLYEKTRRNFPEAREVRPEHRLLLGRGIAEIAARHGMQVYTCLEGTDLAPFGINTRGCMTKEVLEHALGEELTVPTGTSPARKGCRCLLGSDIGAYNTCRHFCRYCYANYDRRTVLQNSAQHDPASPLLVGHLHPEDQIREAKQTRYRTGQLLLW